MPKSVLCYELDKVSTSIRKLPLPDLVFPSRLEFFRANQSASIMLVRLLVKTTGEKVCSLLTLQEK